MSKMHWAFRSLMVAIAFLGFAAVFNARAQQNEKPIGILFAAGDIANCKDDPDRSGRTTAELIRDQIAKAASDFPGVEIRILALGDLAYPSGSTDSFKCFDKTWGKLRDRILPAPGNHDLETQGGKPYFKYFNATLEALGGDKTLGTYAFGFPPSAEGDPPWLIVALNSHNELSSKGQQAKWLSEQLSKTKAKCILAFAHAPLYSSGRHGHADITRPKRPPQNGNESLNLAAPLRPEGLMRPFFRILHEQHASLYLAGHDHHYEQLGRAGAEGKPEDLGQSAIAADGVRSFIVGTGGAELHATHPKIGKKAYDNKWAFQEAYDIVNRGVLKIELRPTSYAWEFIPTEATQLVKKDGVEMMDTCNRS